MTARALAPFLALLAVTMAPDVQAAGRWSYGLQAGLVEARMHGDYGNSVAAEYRPGFTIGGHARYHMTPSYSVQPELRWIQKGGNGDLDFGTTQVSVENDLSYLELPILFRAQPSRSTGWIPFFVAGPTFAFRTSGDVEATFPETSPGPNPLQWFARTAEIIEAPGTLTNPDFADFDFGAALGGGMTFGSGPLRYAFEVRYTRGFSQVRNGIESTNGAFTGTLGIEF